jgi:tetratricopeptide (TPR) repeat protein
LDSKTDAQSLASFRKAVETLQPSLVSDPNNAEIRRLVAYYQFTIGQLLGDMNQTPAALAQEREALASFQKLAAADPANAQLPQDIGRVRGHIGELLMNAREDGKAILELQRSLALLDKMADANNPMTLVGYTVMTDRFWLGRAHVELASDGNPSASVKADHCRQAQRWFHLCLPQYEALRDRDPQSSDATDRIHEVQQEMSRCSVPGR